MGSKMANGMIRASGSTSSARIGAAASSSTRERALVVRRMRPPSVPCRFAAPAGLDPMGVRVRGPAHRVRALDSIPLAALDLGEVMKVLRRRLPPETIVTNGAGNYTGWVHRFYTFRRYRTQLAPTSGAMGYGAPAAVAAKLVHPERLVVSVNGDGCFLMCGQELATAVRYGLDPIFLVVNNGMYGTIRMHQERD